jgi:hypothetical protein
MSSKPSPNHKVRRHQPGIYRFCSSCQATDDPVSIYEQIGRSAFRARIAAADLVVGHKFPFWNALFVTAAAEAGCTLLLSEDMQDGFATRGLTVANPLRDTLHSKLAGLIERPTMAARLAWNGTWNIERRGGGVSAAGNQGAQQPT